MLKHMIPCIFLICSQISFASESDLPILSNPTQQMLQQHNLNSIQATPNTNSINIIDNSQEEIVSIVSAQGTQFSVSMLEIFEILSIVPVIFRNPNDQRQIKLRDSVIVYLLKMIRQGTRSTDLIHISSPNSSSVGTLTLSETIVLYASLPSSLLTVSYESNSILVKLSNLAVYVLMCVASDKSDWLEHKFLNASNDVLEALAKEAEYYGISSILKALKRCALYLEKSSTGAHDKVVMTKRKREDREEESTGFVNCAEFGIRGNTIRIGTTPIKKMFKFEAKNKDGKEIRILTSDTYEFCSGFFINFCPLCPYSSVAIDAGLPLWDELASEFVELWLKAYKNNNPFGISSEEQMFILFTKFIHREDVIHSIHKMAILRRTIYGPECRHFSLYAAILFSKVVARLRNTHRMRIQMIESRTYNIADLSRVSGTAHQWNLVSIFDEVAGNSYYLFDVHNGVVVKLDLEKIKESMRETGTIAGLRVMIIESDIRITTLNTTDGFYENVLFTIESKFHKETGINSIYSEKNSDLLTRLGQFLASQSCTHPQNEFEIIKYYEEEEKK